MPAHRFSVRHALPVILFGAACSAHATNGYFSHGYGAKALGQAGVGVAWAQDALAAATNPAGTLAVGDRVDLGLTWFAPKRSASVVGNAFGADAGYDGNGKKNFFIPEFGWATRLLPTLAAGVAVYGNGGMNTDYAANPYARFGATGRAGVNLEQLFVSPSLAWQPAAGQSLGVSLPIAHQRFKAQGLGFFSGFSSAPGQVSDRGTDTTTGVGLRLGWQGRVGDSLTLGATWASRIQGRFKKYAGLFAEQGGFDVPEDYALGLRWQATPAWALGADVQTIRYSRVAAVGGSLAPLLQGQPLGATHGPGFGWKDVTVLKLAVEHRVDAALTLRAGVSHGNQPVPQAETFFNVLAPGVVRDHLSLGATVATAGGEWTVYAAHAFGNTVTGSGSIPAGNPPAGFGGGNAVVRLSENLLGLAYAWKF